MALETPALQKLNLPQLASRYVNTDDIPWEPMAQSPGIEMKVLVSDPDSGLFTGLFKMAPGAIVPDHVHNEIEQTYVLEGDFCDQDGEAHAGDFIWRPKGNRHEAYTKNGCVILGFFLKPNTFL
ncbi:MAG: cupin domain-containing protein [Gammaproteobacteria bacterium]|nr:cupin domain-containing protein [Gammaproteobacteria bacterium]